MRYKMTKNIKFVITRFVFSSSKFMLKGSNFPPNFPKNSTESAKVARKLRSMAKIVRLRENAKVAQKLRSATSQFSGGTTKIGSLTPAADKNGKCRFALKNRKSPNCHWSRRSQGSCCLPVVCYCSCNSHKINIT